MLMNFSLLQKGELVMIRRAIDRDASRIAEISVFSKRMNYREIFHDDMVSFGEIQVYPLAKEYIEHPEILKEFYVYEDDFVKGFIHIQGTQVLELYVDTFFVDQGIGGKLLDFAVSRNCNSLEEYKSAALLFATRFYSKWSKAIGRGNRTIYH